MDHQDRRDPDQIPTDPPPGLDEDLVAQRGARRCVHLQGAVAAAESDLVGALGREIPESRAVRVSGVLAHHLGLAFDAGSAPEIDLRMGVAILSQSLDAVQREVAGLVQRIEEQGAAYERRIGELEGQLRVLRVDLERERGLVAELRQDLERERAEVQRLRARLGVQAG